MVACLRLFKPFCFGLILFFGSGFGICAGEVVSTSLCADAYVLAIANPQNIKALSWQSGGPLSQGNAGSKGNAKAWMDPEILLSLSPAHFVLGPGDGIKATNWAAAHGAKIHQIGWQNDFDGIALELARLGTFLGRQETAAQRTGALRHALQTLKVRRQSRAHAHGRDLRVLYLTPTLGTAGKGTFIDAAIHVAGGINVAGEMGITGWGQIPVERLAHVKVDLLLTSFFTDGPPSVHQFRVHHPLVQNLRNAVMEQNISGRLWICAGPNLIHAARQIADGLEKIGKGTPGE